MAEKKVIDWEKIELDYRAGIKSLRQIAGEHHIAESGIRRRAKLNTNGTVIYLKKLES